MYHKIVLMCILHNCHLISRSLVLFFLNSYRDIYNIPPYGSLTHYKEIEYFFLILVALIWKHKVNNLELLYDN